jgi:membrane fusion protein (multidrug efflux system)
MADVAAADKRTESKPPKRPRSSRRRRLARRILFPVILLALAAGGYRIWEYVNTYESTDDAQIDGYINAISARISGHVIEVLVDNEMFVQAGAVLVRIDPKDYQVAVEQAQANLADAQAAYNNARINVPITTVDTASQLKQAHSGHADALAAVAGAQRQLEAARARLDSANAQVVEAQANYTRTASDAARYRQLVAKDEIARQQYEDAQSTADAARATVDARKAAVNEAEHNIKVAQTAVDQANARVGQAEASIQAAQTAPQQVEAAEARAKSAQAQVAQRQAQLDQAKLNLSYTTIVAPVDGIVGRRTVAVGQNVSPGQQLMAVVPIDNLWVTANFKETQLRHMKPGQRATFTVDASDRKYTGRVQGIGGATGSRFSLLPPENATGNYVKVVQRIPVRIDIDPGQNKDRRLRPGMSVMPKVFIR